jgi:hypothetical protein
LDYAAIFDRVVVIDTNKRTIAGEHISGCCFILIEVEENPEHFLIQFSDQIHFYDFAGNPAHENPEMMAI